MTRRSCERSGWTDGQIDHEIRYGRWHAPASGVVALQNADADPRPAAVAGRPARRRAAPSLTHLTACRAAGLEWTGDDDTIDVLTPKGDLVEPLDGFFFHQTRRPYQHWLRPTPSGPPRLPIEHAALLTAERDRSLRRAIGLLAACVQQGLTTADRLILTKPQIRKLRHGDDLRARARATSPAAPSRSPRSTSACSARRPGSRRRRARRCGPTPTAGVATSTASGELPDGRVVVLEVDGSFHLQVGNWWRDMKRERAVVLSASTVLRCASIELRLEPVAGPGRPPARRRPAAAGP